MGVMDRLARMSPLRANLLVGGIASVPLGGYGLYCLYHATKPREWTMKKEGVAELGGTYTLVNHFGEPRTQADLHGTWPVMYFGFTHCPDICPQQLDRLGEALTLVKKRRPAAVLSPMFVCCDPGRDSVQACRRTTAEFHPDIVGMTGAPQQIQALVQKYRVFFSKPSPEEVESGDYIVDHSIATFLFDPSGTFVEYWSTNHTAADVADRIVKEIDQWALRAQPFG